jgi:DNA-directed RNA polymerase specialized sigma24 family protein
MSEGDLAELANVTPAEAYMLVRRPELLDKWMARVGLTSLPQRVFRRLSDLSWQAQVEARVDATARQAAAAHSDANRRRADLAELRELVAGAGDRLPVRLRQVAHFCIVAGAAIAQAAEALDMAPATVRVHLRRLRAIARHNNRR